MRRIEREGTWEDAMALFGRAPVVHLATTTPDGAPVLRVVHGVVEGGEVCFHGAPQGEKMESLGRAAVLSAEEIVVDIPSWFHHPERACPATTLYRSAQLSGVLTPVEDPARKARVLMELMARFQPEGGYRPIDPDDPMYRAAVAGIAIVRVERTSSSAKISLMQDKSDEVRGKVLAALWKRGNRGDLEAMEAIRAAKPDGVEPAFLTWAGGKLRVFLSPERVPEAVALLREEYWNKGVGKEVTCDDATIGAATLGATAWIGAEDTNGQLVATMRAVSDTARHAWIGDVAVAPAWRGRGLGTTLFRLFLDHPVLRRVRRIQLTTRDAMGFYAAHGFVVARVEGDRSHMERVRQPLEVM
jgi:predicted GNAT family N-acyltransferase/nitroimidazol reductase NimA-like FMN-containing flavoprotein (pyridoxamine 5'-phosphate oxidase superfamily)